MEEIVARLEALERANRRLRHCVVLAMAGAILPWLLAATSASAPRALEVSSLTLRDDDGRRRGGLSIDSSGEAMLALADAAGRDRFIVSTAAAGAATFGFYDAEGHPRARFRSLREASLNFYDRGGKLRVAFGITEYGPRWASELVDQAVQRSKQASGPFALSGLGEDVSLPAPAARNESNDGPVLRFLDPRGRPRLEARLDMDRPAIFLQTEEGGLQLLRPPPTPVPQSEAIPR